MIPGHLMACRRLEGLDAISLTLKLPPELSGAFLALDLGLLLVSTLEFLHAIEMSALLRLVIQSSARCQTCGRQVQGLVVVSSVTVALPLLGEQVV